MKISDGEINVVIGMCAGIIMGVLSIAWIIDALNWKIGGSLITATATIGAAFFGAKMIRHQLEVNFKNQIKLNKNDLISDKKNLKTIKKISKNIDEIELFFQQLQYRELEFLIATTEEGQRSFDVDFSKLEPQIKQLRKRSIIVAPISRDLYLHIKAIISILGWIEVMAEVQDHEIESIYETNKKINKLLGMILSNTTDWDNFD